MRISCLHIGNRKAPYIFHKVGGFFTWLRLPSSDLMALNRHLSYLAIQKIVQALPQQ